MRLSIRSKLILWIGLPLLLINLGVIVLDSFRTKQTAITQTHARLNSHARSQALRIEGALQRVEEVGKELSVIVGVSQTQGIRRERYWQILLRTLMRNSRILSACVAFEPQEGGYGMTTFAPVLDRIELRDRLDRRPSTSHPRIPLPQKERKDYFRKDWYRQARETGKAAWSEPFIRRVEGQMRMVSIYSVPIRSEGEFLGVAAVDIDLSGLRRVWKQNRLRYEQSVVLSRAGQFLCFPDESCVMNETTLSYSRQPGQSDWARVGEAMVSGGQGLEKVNAPDGVKWVVYTPIRSAGWSYGAVLPEEKLMEPVREYIRSEVGILLVSLGLLELVVLVMSVRLTRPIKKLAAAVRELAAGDFHAKVAGAEGHDEIGDLAGAFNGMVDNLNAHVRELSHQMAARETVENELNIARKIQNSMLPRYGPTFAQRDEFALHALNHPAKHVAGDFYDFFWTRDAEVLGVLVADVSGKGVPAALFMAVARTVVRNLAIPGDLSPGEVLRRANHTLLEGNEQSMFVTVFFAYYHTRTGELHYANAGHNPPYIVAADRGLRQVGHATGTLLGVLDGQTYDSRREPLAPGETLVLYTDGVTEAVSPKDQQYGLGRLEELLTRKAYPTPEVLASRIVQEVDEFQAHVRSDDITVLALRRN